MLEGAARLQGAQRKRRRSLRIMSDMALAGQGGVKECFSFKACGADDVKYRLDMKDHVRHTQKQGPDKTNLTSWKERCRKEFLEVQQGSGSWVDQPREKRKQKKGQSPIDKTTTTDNGSALRVDIWGPQSVLSQGL